MSSSWPGDERLKEWHNDPRDEPLEIEEESDSEDYTHLGNGTPCKFYNTGFQGCRHGVRCHFMHAPDSRSVRDEL